MKKKVIILLCLSLMLTLISTAQGTTLHIHYFESFDVNLDADSLKIFSFSARQGEEITIVAYGLEDDVSPGLSLLNPLGSAIAEDLNADGDEIAYVQASITDNGMYTFLVSRQTDSGGLVRIMLMEGDALNGNITLLDTLDPLQPSRAFLVAGDPAEPIQVSAELIIDPEKPGTLEEFYVSRGNVTILPPRSERTTAVQEHSWFNDEDTLYTINVRPIPEMLTSWDGEYLVFNRRQFVLSNYYLIINQGSDTPEVVDRTVCGFEAQTGGPVYAGPGEIFPILGQAAPGTHFEITGIAFDDAGDRWFEIIWETSERGAGYVPASVELEQQPSCGQVEEVLTPPSPTAFAGGSGSGSTGSSGPGLAPLTNFSGGMPGPGEEDSGSPPIDNPPPPPPPIDDGSSGGGSSGSGACAGFSVGASKTCTGPGTGTVSVSYSGAPGTETKFYLDGSLLALGSPPSGSFGPYFFSSGENYSVAVYSGGTPVCSKGGTLFCP